MSVGKEIVGRFLSMNGQIQHFGILGYTRQRIDDRMEFIPSGEGVVVKICDSEKSGIAFFREYNKFGGGLDLLSAAAVLIG